MLQRVRFVPLKGTLADFRLYVLLAPHLANRGSGNTAWVGDYKGAPMLFAERDSFALALASSAPWLARSVGFVGISDGWQELQAHKRLLRTYQRAENGNVALTGEIDLGASDGVFVLALGFGPTATEAGQHARISLLEDFDRTKAAYVAGWKAWHKTLRSGTAAKAPRRSLYHLSAAVLRTHESKRVEGGVIASLSIPWGFSKGDDDLGGYHLVWPRDLVETAGGFLAVGAASRGEACAAVPAGHAGGRRPLVAEHVARRHAVLARASRWTKRRCRFCWSISPLAKGVIDQTERDAFWPMVRRAAAFLVRNGPVSPQDRWEEDPGYSPFTIAAEIAALLVAADLADAAEHADGRDVSAGNGRRLECQHRTMAVCHRHRTRAAARRRRLLRPGRRAGSSRCRVAVPRFRADQEPSSGSVDRPGGVDGQSRRARVRALRSARTGRSAHREHGEGHRRDAQGRHAARSGVASLPG